MTGIEIAAVAAAAYAAVVAALPAIIISVALNLVISLLIGAPKSTSVNTISGARMSDTGVPTSNYGIPIGWVYADTRVTGTLIWANQIREAKSLTVAQQTSGGGKSGKSKTISRITSFSYFADFAILLCKGPISSVLTLKMNGKTISSEFIAKYVRIYLGDDTQTPDTLITDVLGVDAVPAYRGRAYLVFDNVPLEDFGNHIPEVSAIVRSPINTVGGMIDDLMGESQIVSYTKDSSINAMTLTGAAINEISTVRGGLQTISAAYGFISTESDGTVKFIKGRAG